MEAIDSDRPQDVGRKHRRNPKAIPRVYAGAVLTTYQRTMREELWGLVRRLRSDTKMTFSERERAWKLAIMLAKELGADLEPPRKLDAPRAVNDAPAAADFG